jgi:LysR family transcriptional regulator, transcriptional activator of nhaA
MNYKHLHYFMQVAKLGGVLRASEQLHLSPQTISGQVRMLETALSTQLFAKSGRGLVLTEAGKTVLDYAEHIFSIGAELEEALRDLPRMNRPVEFRIGVADAVPKAIASRLIEPATRLPTPAKIVCREWKLDALLGELALHRLDLVIADAPIPPAVSVRAFAHRLGSSGTSFFAAHKLTASLIDPFPNCLDGAPMLMPAEDSAVGQRLRAWLKSRSLRPRVIAECDDSALAKAFGLKDWASLLGQCAATGN